MFHSASSLDWQSDVMAPDNAAAILDLSLERLEMGDRSGAIADFNRAIVLEPSADAYATRARVRRDEGDLAASLADYGSAIALEPQRVRLYVGRALTFRRAERLAEAEADMDRALSLDPGRSEDWLYRGTIRRLRGNPEGALRDDDEAVRLGLSQRGLLLEQHGDHSSAMADLRRATALELATAETWANLSLTDAGARLERGDPGRR